MNLPSRLYLISDRTRMGEDPVGAAVRAVHAGARMLQWREKDLTPRANLAALEELEQRLAAALGPGAEGWPLLFVNDRADLALARGIHLHLTEESIPTRLARRLLGETALVGRSVHDGEGAASAAAGGADFVTFGPVYDTPSKRAYGPPRGVDALAAICSSVAIPVFAIGGITTERAGDCIAAGAHGVAVIGGIWDAPDPEMAIQRYLNVLATAGDPR